MVIPTKLNLGKGWFSSTDNNWLLDKLDKQGKLINSDHVGPRPPTNKFSFASEVQLNFHLFTNLKWI